MHSTVTEAQKIFEQEFGSACDLVVQAPGRVNLIGEHTDYNDGFVFPVAIDRYVTLAVKKREDQIARVYSSMHGEMGEVSLNEPLEPVKHWSDYGKGVIREFQKLGKELCGFDAVLVGNVPMGAGLSSSAAVEMAVGKMLMELNGISISGSELALLGQRAENQFVGVNCGIMDQFISANGKEGHALFLDCRDLSFELVPLASDGVNIVICNSAVTRGLTDSAYNERRSACELGVSQIGEASGKTISALRDVDLDMLNTYKDKLSEEGYRRCHHVITENARTEKAVEYLKQGDIAAFGKLMGESHVSLRDDYEVSGKELDLLVEIASGLPGVLGARMTGAGFGGCTVNLVESDCVAAFQSAIEEQYTKATELKPEIYVCAAVNGAERVI